MLITINDIANKLGVSRQAVSNRVQNLDEYLAAVKTNGGRPCKLYRSEVIAVLRPGLKYEVIESQEEFEKNRVRSVRSDRGEAQLIREDLERKLKEVTFEYYLNQGRNDNIEQCARWAVKELWEDVRRTKWVTRYVERSLKKGKEPEVEEAVDAFVWYFYNKRLMRRDKFYTGYVWSENWRLHWDSKHQVNKFNSSLPTLRWNMFELFIDAGLIKEGHGAGSVWVVDGTQFDIWVKDGVNKQAHTMNYLAIIDGITGFPMYFKLLANGESIQEVGSAFAECLALHGKPSFGVVMDNGRAFRSKEIQNYIRSWYTPAELAKFDNWDFRKNMFGGQNEPFIYPLAKIPRYPFKSMLERKFDEFNRHQSEVFAISYIGSRDSRAITHELGSTPLKALEYAPKATEAFSNFVYYIYTEMVHQIRGGELKYFKKVTGMTATLSNCWKYLGGKFELAQKTERLEPVTGNMIKENKSLVLLEGSDKSEALVQSKAYEIFATAPDNRKHKVKANYGHCSVIEDGVNYNFHCEGLDITLAGRTVTVVVFEKKAYIFKEYEQNFYDERTPQPTDVFYIGEGFDATIRKVSDMSMKSESTQLRKRLQKNIDEKVRPISENGHSKNVDFANIPETAQASYPEDSKDSSLQKTLPPRTLSEELSDEFDYVMEDNFSQDEFSQDEFSQTEDYELNDFLNF